jgi:hypothetical protein
VVLHCDGQVVEVRAHCVLNDIRRVNSADEATDDVSGNFAPRPPAYVLIRMNVRRMVGTTTHLDAPSLPDYRTHRRLLGAVAMSFPTSYSPPSMRTPARLGVSRREYIR